jgi:hypothetical protein
MTTYAIACNEQTTFYEVHKPGCAHLNRTDKYLYSTPAQAESAQAAAANFEAANEGCFTKISPCAKGAA